MNKKAIGAVVGVVIVLCLVVLSIPDARSCIMFEASIAKVMLFGPDRSEQPQAVTTDATPVVEPEPGPPSPLEELVGSKYRHVFSNTQDWLFSFNSTDSVQIVDTLRYPSINENCRIFKTNNGAEGDFVIELSKFEDMPGHKYTRESWACNYSGGILTAKLSYDYYDNLTDELPKTVSIGPEAVIMDRQIN